MRLGKDKDGFIVLDEQLIVQERQNTLEESAAQYGISLALTAALLKYFQWDLDKFHQEMEADMEKVFHDAKVESEAHLDQSNQKGKGKGQGKGKGKAKIGSGVIYNAQLLEQKTGTCPICFEDSMKLSALECGHFVCDECWEYGLSIKITECEVTGLKCMGAAECKLVVPEILIQRLVSGEIYEKYLRFLMASYVKEAKLVKWCPRPGCDKAVAGRTNEKLGKGVTITCACGFKFCFDCGNESHAPASCEDVVKWKQKFDSDEETLKYMSVYVKPCPKCHTLVKKEEGCNHIWNDPCGFHWCWVCNQAWEGHDDYYNCNKFTEEKKKEVKNEQDEALAALEKWKFYSERYADNVMSEELEKKNQAKAEAKMKEMAEASGSFIDSQFLMRAVEQLAECRRLLKFTYLHAYFLPSAERELFEFHQKDLLAITDKLSETLTTPVETLMKPEGVSRINNLISVAKKNFENMEVHS
eukprot:TRINITY_DN1020_c0_g1_i12.p1 TRINITY_DN1020_c0_g1~~TRINITY_DN1020_c0_g1_i12.p1  ORF type:complete len:485 (+),score=147.49 TRINITY_DN1020_c0_g1_i12:45-1457(+)